MQVLGTRSESKESATARFHEGGRGEGSAPRVTICKEEPPALKLLVEGAEVEKGRDGSVAVSGWRGIAEGSGYRAVVCMHLVGEVGFFSHLRNRI